MSTMTKSNSRLPSIRCQYLKEPMLRFAGDGEDIDPRAGISSFGPKSYKSIWHPETVRVGFIGTGETISKAREWIEKCAQGVQGDDKHPTFPGYAEDRGFFSKLLFNDDWYAQINHAETDEIMHAGLWRVRFEQFVALLDKKLDLLARKERPPEYIVLALPDDLYQKFRVVEYREKSLGEIHRDLRRAFKAIAMKYRISTQILREETTGEDPEVHLSQIAWNFFVGLYYKAGGYPWWPVGLTPGTCYIGVSFYRPLGSESKMRTSLIQAFDEHGDGLVLRGHEFTWDSKEEHTSAPHLNQEQAYKLVELVLEKYREELKQTPQRVVVHKTSRYWPAEQEGFEQALSRHVQQYDLMALAPQSTIRLLTASKYPPLRGTHFRVEDLDYLYTTGFIAELNQFHGMHVPSPLQIADHIGYDTPRDTLLKEILILTKMNWNSAHLGGLWPITLRFSRLVGDIMREIPSDRQPLPNFKYYM